MCITTHSSSSAEYGFKIGIVTKAHDKFWKPGDLEHEDVLEREEKKGVKGAKVGRRLGREGGRRGRREGGGEGKGGREEGEKGRRGRREGGGDGKDGEKRRRGEREEGGEGGEEGKKEGKKEGRRGKERKGEKGGKYAYLTHDFNSCPQPSLSWSKYILGIKWLQFTGRLHQCHQHTQSITVVSFYLVLPPPYIYTRMNQLGRKEGTYLAWGQFMTM